MRLLVDILAELADGNAVKVVPIHAELTTQEAANMLNVSRPHLVKLLESGALPFHKAGKHRRVRFADLMAFKAERDRASSLAMEELGKRVPNTLLTRLSSQTSTTGRRSANATRQVVPSPGSMLAVRWLMRTTVPTTV